VGNKVTDVFWSINSEHLDEKEIQEAIDIVVDGFSPLSYLEVVVLVNLT
jgi:hypothetical protein